MYLWFEIVGEEACRTHEKDSHSVVPKLPYICWEVLDVLLTESEVLVTWICLFLSAYICLLQSVAELLAQSVLLPLAEYYLLSGQVQNWR